MRSTYLRSAAVAAFLAAGVVSASADNLTLYCAADEAWCQQVARGFEEETGITVDMTRKSSGEIYAQVRAEAANPKGDVWWAGTGDPHLQAAEEGLTVEYVSPNASQLHDWALKQAAAANNKTVGVYSGALGFGYNKDLLAKNGLPEPKCWADLIKPEYKGQIQMANPNSSGTAYTMLATMVHDAVSQAAAGFPIVPVAPCEGTGYEIGSMSIIKGARNEEQAKKFYDWALTADMQNKAKDVKSFQIPSNKNATPSPLSPDLSTIKLIDYDFKKYGSSEERKRLLQKWDTEVSSLPQ
jgi:iron(III) transport system substrate-binding protein